MPKISVITCSVRPEGIPIVEKALRRQTFQDFEHIIQGAEAKKNPGDYWTIYKDYNISLHKAKGKLIVSWQDFTFAKPDALEKFWGHYMANPKALVSGVGDKYSDDTFTVKTWADPRKRSDQGSFYPCFFNDIEWNFCAVPKEAVYAVGGFDEYLDKYSSLCGLDVLDRLNILGGWEFYLDQTNESFSLEHGRLPKWEENLPFNGPYDERRKAYIENPILPYLR
jgi:hypothetical protein